MSVQSSAMQVRAFDRDYPTRDTARRVYTEQLLQRAVEAYRFFYPTVSMEGCFHGGRELGMEDNGGIVMLAASPRHLILTSNSDTPYACGALDLAAAGPMVIELPAGPYVGMIDDHHFRWVVDLGLSGADGGRGGRYVVLPPDFEGSVPSGAHVARSATNKVLLALRAIPTNIGVAGAMAALRRVKVHPLANPGAAIPFTDVTEKSLDMTSLRWEDNLEFWRRLHAVLDEEPTLEDLRPMYGELAALGIAKGYPFPTDRGTHELLERAARTGLEQMRVAGFASLRPDRVIWTDREWEWVGLVSDPNFETTDFIDLEARDRWFIQAVGASPAMFRRQPGSGSIYFLAARDATGAYLEGSRTYKLTVPLPVPARLFWSVTVYDAHTRCQIQTPQDRAVIGSLQNTFNAKAGSAELYFGPDAPPGNEQHWIKTIPGAGFFLYFRIYGPETASLDGTWRPGDVIRVSS